MCQEFVLRNLLQTLSPISCCFSVFLPPKKGRKRRFFEAAHPPSTITTPMASVLHGFLFCLFYEFRKFSFFQEIFIFTFQDFPPTKPRQSCTYRPGGLRHITREKRSDRQDYWCLCRGIHENLLVVFSYL
ncbi:GPI-anchored surface protein, putative [Bodo saltans]|uniref:GPI-anchored surface protein, putative n=1 Tax=Bodo saltans TaxID=75058 RepID=A0A0S4IR16_BODSA|nr:GPI-anchored surface protein, putative [Bodo saltans]|eukprot:CUF37647.1 GPI-anchored surface protein, putative [Bodo saltans]